MPLFYWRISGNLDQLSFILNGEWICLKYKWVLNTYNLKILYLKLKISKKYFPGVISYLFILLLKIKSYLFPILFIHLSLYLAIFCLPLNIHIYKSFESSQKSISLSFKSKKRSDVFWPFCCRDKPHNEISGSFLLIRTKLINASLGWWVCCSYVSNFKTC